MPKLKVNDIELYYESIGNGEPLILIAGFSADHTAWSSVTEALSQSYRVITFDNRGAGQSSIPDAPYSIEQLSDDLASLCKALNITKAHFIGNSMGGFILQNLCLTHPELVKSAIISNSTFSIKAAPFHLYVSAHREFIKINAPKTALIKAMCSWAFSSQFLNQPGMMDFLIQVSLENPYPFTLKGYDGQFAAIHNFDSSEWIDKIKTPTLVIGADQDLIFSEASIRELSKKIKNAEYFCFPNCGHLPYIEYPEKFIAIVLKFLKSTCVM